jgi:hypothetical protein
MNQLELRIGKEMTVRCPISLGGRCNAKGVGSRFRATTNHMEDAFPENDSRPPSVGRNQI